MTYPKLAVLKLRPIKWSFTKAIWAWFYCCTDSGSVIQTSVRGSATGSQCSFSDWRNAPKASQTIIQVKAVLFTNGRLFMSTKSILLIEHETNIREVLHTCLSEFGGWRVTLSDSIQKGVNLCMTTCPDAILLDTSTSETDALIFIEQLKQHSTAQSIPILLITARASWFTLKQLHQMGFAGAITKPFNPSTLPAEVSCLLGWSNGDL